MIMEHIGLCVFVGIVYLLMGLMFAHRENGRPKNASPKQKLAEYFGIVVLWLPIGIIVATAFVILIIPYLVLHVGWNYCVFTTVKERVEAVCKRFFRQPEIPDSLKKLRAACDVAIKEFEAIS